MPAHHHIQTCWQRVDAALASEISEFWRRERAIGDGGEAERRAAEAVCVVRDDAGALLAVATAQPRLIPFLGQTLYYLRAYVARAARGGGWMPLRLLGAAQRALAEDAASERPASPAIGIFLELESPMLARSDRAVWPRSGFVYAGRTPRGLQRRIWYFPDARIAPDAAAPQQRAAPAE